MPKLQNRGISWSLSLEVWLDVFLPLPASSLEIAVETPLSVGT